MSDNKMYEKYPMPHIPTKEEIEDTQTNQEYIIRTKNELKKKVGLFGAGSDELVKFLDNKLEHAQSNAVWFWLQGIYKVEQYLDEDGNLDEITMQGEFNEEIDIVKEWIKEWKNGL